VVADEMQALKARVASEWKEIECLEAQLMEVTHRDQAITKVWRARAQQELAARTRPVIIGGAQIRAHTRLSACSDEPTLLDWTYAERVSPVDAALTKTCSTCIAQHCACA
jgi:hypothetical protein